MQIIVSRRQIAIILKRIRGGGEVKEGNIKVKGEVKLSQSWSESIMKLKR